MPQTVMDPLQQRPLTTRVSQPQRELPETSEDTQWLAKEKCFVVYNVGPWQHQRNMGSWGSVTIPACPTERQWADMDEKERAKYPIQTVDGRRYVEMFPLQPALSRGVPGIYHEPMIDDEKNMKLVEVGQKKGALLVAEQVLGVGSHQHPLESWARFGVFIGKERGPKAKPLVHELEAAEKALMGCYWEYFTEAEDAIRAGGINPGLIIDDKRHRLSALEIGRTDVSWMRQVNPTQRQDCPGCGTQINVGIMLCPQCRFVLDTERYDSMVIEGRMKDPERFAFLKEASAGSPAKRGGK